MSETYLPVKRRANTVIRYSILVCGLVQAHYSCGNISSKSFISVTYIAKCMR